MWGRRDESAARIPILIIYVVPTIRCIAAGALTGSVRVHAATSRRSRIGGARCCSASCACRSTSATGTSSRSAAGATGATTSRSAASATTATTALCQRGRTDGDCCKERESEYFSYRHGGRSDPARISLEHVDYHPRRPMPSDLATFNIPIPFESLLSHLHLVALWRYGTSTTNASSCSY